MATKNNPQITVNSSVGLDCAVTFDFGNGEVVNHTIHVPSLDTAELTTYLRDYAAAYQRGLAEEPAPVASIESPIVLE